MFGEYTVFSYCDGNRKKRPIVQSLGNEEHEAEACESCNEFQGRPYRELTSLLRKHSIFFSLWSGAVFLFCSRRSRGVSSQANPEDDSDGDSM